VYANNIVPFLKDYSDWRVPGDMGRSVGRMDLRTRSAANKTATSHVELRQLLGQKPSGVYLLNAWPDDEDWRPRRQLMLITI
jgi:hypothetical protein